MLNTCEIVQLLVPGVLFKEGEDHLRGHHPFSDARLPKVG